MRVMMRLPTPHGNYSVSVTDFLLFTVPANEPTSILSFNQCFALSQIHFSHYLRLFFILSFRGKKKKIQHVALLDVIPCPSPQNILKWTKFSKKNGELEVRNNTFIGPHVILFIWKINFSSVSFYSEGQGEDLHSLWSDSFTWSKCCTK